jgi:hypothetical protein
MSRHCLMVVAVSLAAGLVGCAHCDTCDDFPTPAMGPYNGMPSYVGATAVPAESPAPAAVSPEPTETQPAPPGGEAGPFTPPPSLTAPYPPSGFGTAPETLPESPPTAPGNPTPNP